jgi:polysaccharide biosynthesis/export protein
MNAAWTILAVSVLLLWSGCTSTRENGDPFVEPVANPPESVELQDSDVRQLESSLGKSLLEPPPDPFRLGPGDRIEIEVLGDRTSLANTFVCPDGKIYFHLLPGLFVWGKTLIETKTLLEAGLAKFLQRPKIAITLREVRSRRFWILGRVYRSGVYPLVRPMRLLEAVARAGGLMVSAQSSTTEELADLRHSFIVRQGRMLPVDFHALLRGGDMTQNIYLQPDDFIYLPSSLSREVYVLGKVRKPSSVAFMNQVTLVGAISSAFGPAEGAHLKQVAIIRGSLSKPSVAVINYNAIISGQRPDIVLEARDIVYVPDKPYADVLDYGKLIVDTFVRTVAANEGSRAAISTTETVGVQLQIGN